MDLGIVVGIIMTANCLTFELYLRKKVFPFDVRTVENKEFILTVDFLLVAHIIITLYVLIK